MQIAGSLEWRIGYIVLNYGKGNIEITEREADIISDAYDAIETDGGIAFCARKLRRLIGTSRHHLAEYEVKNRQAMMRIIGTDERKEEGKITEYRGSPNQKGHDIPSENPNMPA